MNTRELTNGRDRAKGWEQNEDGNWIASAYDRRRILTSALAAIAEVQEGVVTSHQIERGLELNSVGEGDSLPSLLAKWMGMSSN